MPTLGKSRSSGLGRNLALAGLLAVVAAGGLWWRKSTRKPAPPPAPVVAPTATKPALAPTAPPPRPPNSDDLLKRAGFRRVHAVVNGPLETAIVQQVGRELGQPLEAAAVDEALVQLEKARLLVAHAKSGLKDPGRRAMLAGLLVPTVLSISTRAVAASCVKGGSICVPGVTVCCNGPCQPTGPFFRCP